MFIRFMGFMNKSIVNFVVRVMISNSKSWLIYGCFLEKFLDGKFCVFDL